jgi:hypothetical protein
MQYFARLSGSSENLRFSGKDRARAAALKHVLGAQRGASFVGSAFTRDRQGNTVAFYRCWIDDEGAIQESEFRCA